jgi:hypothetical protein
MQDPTTPEYLFTLTEQFARSGPAGMSIPFSSFLRGDSAFNYCNYVEVYSVSSTDYTSILGTSTTWIMPTTAQAYLKNA